MTKYRVKAGKSFGPGGRYPAGTVLELTEAEAQGFKDKLERVADSAPVGLINEIKPDEPVGLKNELGAEVPEELKILPQEKQEQPPAVSAETQSQSPEPKSKPRTQRKKAAEG